MSGYICVCALFTLTSWFFWFLLFIICAVGVCFFFFLMIRRPPRSTLDRSSAASDVYKRQHHDAASSSSLPGKYQPYPWRARSHRRSRAAALWMGSVSYTHLRAHETVLDLVCRLLLEKKNTTQTLDIISTLHSIRSVLTLHTTCTS